jgi:hypothetical protein
MVVAMDLFNSGNVEVLSGTLDVSCGYVQTAGNTIVSGGSMTGQVSIQGGSLEGSTSGDLTNSGQVSLVPSTGSQNTAGNYNQSSNESLASS